MNLNFWHHGCLVNICASVKWLMDPVSIVYIPEIHSVSIFLWKLNVMHFINIFPQFITLNLWQACLTPWTVLKSKTVQHWWYFGCILTLAVNKHICVCIYSCLFVCPFLTTFETVECMFLETLRPVQRHRTYRCIFRCLRRKPYGPVHVSVCLAVAFFAGKVTLYGRVLRYVACVTCT